MKHLAIDPNKHSSDIARIKQKIRENQAKKRQYNSLCYDLDQEPAAQQNADKVRRQSKKDAKNGSSKKLIRSKSRSNDCAPKSIPLGNKNIGALYGELMTVKSQYKKLKGSYEKLSQQKLELTTRGLIGESQERSKEGQLAKQLLKYKKVNGNIESELQRIRKESMRIIETERFKNKKLEEIIQEKELMISFLRNQLDKIKKNCESTYSTANQTAINIYPHNLSQLGYPSSVNSSNIIIDAAHRSRIEEDSLCFSRDIESFNSILTCYDPKKECVIIEPKKDDPYTEPSQCLTFEQRDEEGVESREMLKLPPKNNKKVMAKSKTTLRHNKRPNMLTLGDENTDTNSKCDSVDQKLLSTYGSKQRKKTMSSRKKI